MTGKKTPNPHESSAPEADIFTIGHSTRPADALVQLLKSRSIDRVVDVRSLPRSRHNPQFNADALEKTLAESRIAYFHCPELGGLRRPAKDSRNMGWRSEAFRGFADYMQTPPFRLGLRVLLSMARTERIALMCAEAVPWRCHRSLIADALVLQGMSVCHLVDGECRTHVVTPWAHVDGRRITYPPPFQR